MSKNLTQLAQDAIDALNAYTEEHKRQKEKWRQSGYAAILNSNTLGISDTQEIELLTAIVNYDEDPAGTLQELIWQTECDHSEDEADYRYEEMRSDKFMEKS
jgi:hypothetical protein